MTAGISGIAGPGEIGRLYGGGGPSPAEMADTRTFFDMFDAGLDRLSTRPDPGGEATRLAALTDPYAGSVGSAKVEILGGAEFRAEQENGAQAATLEERITSLYFELTHYQVAWKIAQNVQRDVSQVLRGG